MNIAGCLIIITVLHLQSGWKVAFTFADSKYKLHLYCWKYIYIEKVMKNIMAVLGNTSFEIKCKFPLIWNC